MGIENIAVGQSPSIAEVGSVETASTGSAVKSASARPPKPTWVKGDTSLERQWRNTKGAGPFSGGIYGKLTANALADLKTTHGIELQTFGENSNFDKLSPAQVDSLAKYPGVIKVRGYQYNRPGNT